jgi:hypothetical protein
MREIKMREGGEAFLEKKAYPPSLILSPLSKNLNG